MKKSAYRGIVGYIGLGDMGGGIATHLADMGVELIVFDLNPTAVDRLVGKGARAAASLQLLAETSDVLIICVDPEPQVQKVVAALVPHLCAGQTVIIQSSVPPTWISQLASAVASSGAKLFDAPVSGSRADRLNGTLAVLVGASREQTGPINGLLETIGRPIYLDAPGGGEAAKLANNAIMAVTRLAVAESMAFAQVFGISEDKLIEAVKVSSGACFAIENWGYFDQQIASGHGPRMSLQQVTEIQKIATEEGVGMRMIRAALEHMRSIDEERYRIITGNAPSRLY